MRRLAAFALLLCAGCKDAFYQEPTQQWFSYCAPDPPTWTPKDRQGGQAAPSGQPGQPAAAPASR